MTVIDVESRKKTTTGGRTRIVVSNLEVPEHKLLAFLLQTPEDTSRDCRWPDGHLEAFYWTAGLQFAGPSNSRLLPEKCRRDHGRWYLGSRRVYWQDHTGRLVSVEVPRAS
jgi:hypothetical protein